MARAFQANAFQSNAFQPADGEVFLGLINQAASAFTPSLTYNQIVDVGLIDRTAAATAPAITTTAGATVGFINQTAAAFAPSVARPITLLVGTESIRTATTTPFSFSSGLSSANSDYQTGVLLSIVTSGTGSDNQISGVTYGGHPMTKVNFSGRSAAGEAGAVHHWFLAHPNRGSQTVVVTFLFAAAQDNQFVIIGMTGDFDAEVIDTDTNNGGGTGADIADPSVVLSTGGKVSLAVATLYSGHDAPSSISELSTMTLVHDHDFGTNSAEVARQTLRGDTDFTAGFIATIEDAALVATLFAETAGNQTFEVGRITNSPTIFAPVVTANQLVSPGLIDRTAVAHAPTLVYNQTVSPAFIDRTAVGFNPQVEIGEVNAQLIVQTAVAHAPTVQWTHYLVPVAIASTRSVFAPTVTRGAVTVSPGFIDRTAVAHAPLVEDPTGTRTVELGLIDRTAVATAPTVAFAAIALGLISQTATPFAPTVAYATKAIALVPIDRTAVAYGPVISSPQALDLGLINRTASAWSPLVSATTGYTPGPGGGTGGTGHTRVFVVGLGDVSPITIFSATRLETAVGGEASPGVIVIRDIGINREQFITGSRVVIDRGPGTDPIYSGYLIKPSRRFFFDVDKPDTLQRQWVLHVADINLLWSRRVLYDKSNPPNITGPKYVDNVFDDVVLAELFRDWVDLSFDDLDTTSRVNRVGLINYDQTTYPFNPSETLGEAVRTIAQLPAAVYGIDSSRRVVYADVDDENAPFVISDAYLPPNNPPPGQLSTSKASAVAITDPPIGRSTFTIPTDTFEDPGDPVEQADWTGQQGPTQWAKLVLTTQAHLRIDTAGSSLEDTVLWIYQKSNPPGPADVAIDMDDDSVRAYLEEMRFHGAYAVWEMAETSGTTMTDWSEPGGRSGFYRNSPTLNQAGPGPGVKSVLFNGTNQYADVSGTTIFGATGTSTLSWACWVKHNGTHGAFYDTIFGKGVGGPQIKLTPEGRIGLAKADEGDLALTLNPVITDTNWHHVIVTWESGVGVSVYIDGAAVAMGSFTNRTFVSNSSRFSIASASGAVWSDGWHGSLAMPGVFDKILSASEAQRLYNNVISRHEILPGFDTFATYEPGTYWIAIQSFNFIHDPWEDQVTLNIIRDEGDTVPEVDPGWTPVGTPGAEIVGPRDPLIVPDGTSLCNDVLAWGFGMGSPNGVFKRLRDASSIDEHGLWQDGITLYSVYKQSTINKVADSVVNGSPGSRRGRKDDRVSVTCTIFRDGLHVGDRVRFISHLYRFEDVIPVRKMEITFPTPDDVQYNLTLSHEIDQWGFQDPLPPFAVPGPYPIPDIVIPPVQPPPNDPSCVESSQSVDGFRFNMGSPGSSGPWTTAYPGSMWGQISNSLVGTNSPRYWGDWGPTSPFGGVNDRAGVTHASEYAFLTVDNKEFGVRQPYYGAAPWNRDTVTGRFRVYFPTVIQPGVEVELTFGAVKAVLRPSDGEVDVVTGSGTSTDPFTDWFADQWYLVETSLDLRNDEVRVKVQRESSPAEFFNLTRAANGERVAEGDYQPELGIWVRSLTAIQTVRFGGITTSTYADASASEGDWIQGWAEPPWSGDMPGVLMDGDGTISVTDQDLLEGGTITRDLPVGIGSIDLAFCLSDYSTSFDVFTLEFDAAGINRFWVSLNELSCRIGNATNDQQSAGYDYVGLFNGQPVNIRVQFSQSFMRFKAWAGGTAEPTGWDATAYFLLDEWPNIILAFQPFLFFSTDTFRLGPLQLESGVQQEPYLVMGPGQISQTGILEGDEFSTNSHGRHKTYGFPNPGGTSASFPASSYVQATYGLPNATASYSVGIAWPIFAPITPENGVPNEIHHRIASITFPAILHDGEPIEYSIRVRGTISVRLGEAAREDLGATGILEPVNVVLECFNYGLGADVSPPPFVDYHIDQGFDVWNSIFENVYIGHPETKEFDIVVNDHLIRNEDGTTVLQMGVHGYGIEHEIIEAVKRTGPLWGGIFLVTGNNGSLGITISSISYEILPLAMGYPINDRLDPCEPDPTGNDYGVPETGRMCVDFIGDGTSVAYPAPYPFIPGSADVIVAGKTLTPDDDFSENGAHDGVVFDTPPALGEWIQLCVTVD